MSQLQKLNENIRALEIALNWENSAVSITEEEIEALKLYHGWGFCKALLFGDGTYQSWIDQGATGNDMKLHGPMQKLFNLLIEHYEEKEYKKVLDSMKNAVLTSYYTPAVVPQVFIEVLKENMDITTIYECSAGSGVFLTEAMKVFPKFDKVCMYEKDLLTGKVLQALMENTYGPEGLYGGIQGFEESSDSENGKYDLLCSNVPFGDVAVYDQEFYKDKTTKDFCKRIHNYFVAKSIEKVHDGGIIAILISNTFLDTVSNKSIRKYLFERCDFISLAVMPDNLMWESAGTMAPSHFLVVQKNSSKTELSEEELLLVESEFVEVLNSKGDKFVKVALNKFINQEGYRTIIGGRGIGTNQYGKPAVETKWIGEINEISKPFREILQKDFAQRFKPQHKDPRQKNWLQNAPDHITQYPLTPEECFSKASEEAIEKGGFSDMFKLRSEWDEEQRTFSMIGLTKPIEIVPCETEQPKLDINKLLPSYVPFKDGIIVEL